jgi:WD40 repeat protein
MAWMSLIHNQPIFGSKGNNNGVAFSPDGKTLATPMFVQLWRVSDGALPRHVSTVSTVRDGVVVHNKVCMGTRGQSVQPVSQLARDRPWVLRTKQIAGMGMRSSHVPRSNVLPSAPAVTAKGGLVREMVEAIIRSRSPSLWSGS